MPNLEPGPPAAGPDHPGQDRRKITSRKVVDLDRDLGAADDSLTAWTQRYLDVAVRGVRSDEVSGKIARYLERFSGWLTAGLGHDRVSAVTPWEVAGWRDHAVPRRDPAAGGAVLNGGNPLTACRVAAGLPVLSRSGRPCDALPDPPNP